MTSQHRSRLPGVFFYQTRLSTLVPDLNPKLAISPLLSRLAKGYSTVKNKRTSMIDAPDFRLGGDPSQHHCPRNLANEYTSGRKPIRQKSGRSSRIAMIFCVLFFCATNCHLGIGFGVMKINSKASIRSRGLDFQPTVWY